MDAWGIQLWVVEDLKKRGCTTIRILEVSSGNVYAMTFNDFLVFGVVRDFGDGKQMFVSRKHFNVDIPQNKKRA